MMLPQTAQAEKGTLLAELEAARAAVAEAEAAKAAACACADTSRSQMAQLETRLLDAQCAPSHWAFSTALS